MIPYAEGLAKTKMSAYAARGLERERRMRVELRGCTCKTIYVYNDRF